MKSIRSIIKFIAINLYFILMPLSEVEPPAETEIIRTIRVRFKLIALLLYFAVMAGVGMLIYYALTSPALFMHILDCIKWELFDPDGFLSHFHVFNCICLICECILGIYIYNYINRLFICCIKEKIYSYIHSQTPKTLLSAVKISAVKILVEVALIVVDVPFYQELKKFLGLHPAKRQALQIIKERKLLGKQFCGLCGIFHKRLQNCYIYLTAAEAEETRKYRLHKQSYAADPDYKAKCDSLAKALFSHKEMTND